MVPVVVGFRYMSVSKWVVFLMTLGPRKFI